LKFHIRTGYHSPYPSVKIGTSTIFRVLGSPIPERNRAVTGGVDEGQSEAGWTHQFPHVQDALDVGVDVSLSFQFFVVRPANNFCPTPRPQFYLYGKVLTA
jgi:hypothetical protein